ncbi:MAG: transglutaminase-like domain-containing protein [Clostridiales bacterium]|jgi:hypothetical protein|nr:transglutaminase-like domain-containing protein [Clostridiales bacterium]
MAKFKWTDNLFFLTMGTLFVWSLFLAVISSTELAFDPMGVLFRVIFVMVVLRIIFLNRYTFWLSLAVVLMAAIVVAIDALAFTPDPYVLVQRTTIFESISQPIVGTIAYIAGLVPLTAQYEMLIAWGITIGLGLFVLLFGFLFFNFFIMLGVSVVTFALVLNSGFFFFSAAFYVYIFCLVAYLIKHLNRRSLGGAKTSPFVLYAMPFTALCLIVAIALPIPGMGAMQNLRQGLNRPFTAINDTIQAALHPRYFSLAQTGFGGSGMRQLGGDVRPNYGRVMRIQPLTRPRQTYLTGAIFDEYTGYSWVNSLRNDYHILDFDQIEQNLEFFERTASGLTLWAAEDFFEVYERTVREITDGTRDSYWITFLREPDWYIMHNIDVYFMNRWGINLPTLHTWGNHSLMDALTIEMAQRRMLVEPDFRTFNIFTKGIVTGVVPPGGETLTRDPNGGILTQELMRRHTRYTVFYTETAFGIFEANIAQASYRGVLRDSHAALLRATEEGFPVEELYFQNANGLRVDFKDLLYDYLIPRADEIFEKYTLLPENFPARIGALAARITEDAITDLDRATMINEFLRTSFGYTLTPGNTPEGRDFVDHFLFDLQEGYCVHFATAFVTMMRSLDIPARYVEGFFVTGNYDEDGFMHVINRQGHAWGEVYFEGFGWFIFEPTPPGAIFAWGPGVGGPNLPFGMAPRAGDLEEIIWEFLDDDAPPLAIMPIGQAGAEEDAMPVAQPLNLGQLLLMSIYLVAAVVLLRFAIRAFLGILRDMKIRKMGNDAAAMAYFSKMLKYLHYFNIDYKQNETPLSFAKKISSRLLGFENDKVSMADIAHILYRAKYSPHSVSDEERALMERVLETLDKRLRGTVGYPKYFVYKYVKVGLS